VTGLALITGGQQGIGLGIATALAGAGFRMAIAAERPVDDPAVTTACAALGASYYRHDLADVAGIPALIDRITAAQGPVTTLVQNAGVAARARGDMLDLTPENLDWILSINLKGAFFLAVEAARRMLALPDTPYRSIIFVTSVSAALASPERADYCISKAGLAMAAQALALRLAPHGIGVFDIRPGIIATPMTAAVTDSYDARIAGGLVPQARWGQPADIGAAVVPLALGQFAFATGAVIPVDGGLSIARL
jgi:NAD(P)-dependent dehydrogenase (short-subunit alcohol dehydrogenase family)